MPDLTPEQMEPRVMSMAPPAPPTVSPYVKEFEDYLGRKIRITVTFDEGTKAITGITVFRDTGCLFTKILIGTGGDGSPDSSTRSVNVPAGTTVLTSPQLSVLASNGLATVDQFWSYQITAGL